MEDVDDFNAPCRCSVEDQVFLEARYRKVPEISQSRFFGRVTRPEARLRCQSLKGCIGCDEKTASGLYLPPGVKEKEKVQQGYVIKAGPGYAIPMPVEDEPWKAEEEKIKYLPLQAKEGDLAIFLVGAATEVMYEGDKYFIVPQSAILMLEREEDL